MLSDSSANAGSRVSRGCACWSVDARYESRREVRDTGRSGVVGREGGLCVREVDLLRAGGSVWGVVDAIVYCWFWYFLRIGVCKRRVKVGWVLEIAECGLASLAFGVHSHRENDSSTTLEHALVWKSPINLGKT